jgi:hypothetical protein
MTKNEYKMSKDIAYIPPAHKVAGIMSGKQSLLITNKGFTMINANPDRYKLHGLDDFCAALFEDLQPHITPWIAPIKSPFGQPGNRLYLRERWYRGYVLDENDDIPEGAEPQYWYFADGRDSRPGDASDSWCYHMYGADKSIWPSWRSAACMPKEAARTWLEVVSVTAKRIQDITEQEAIAAGVQFITAENKDRYYRHYMADNADLGLKDRHYSIQNNPIASFRTLWDKHHPGSWERNDWVWMSSVKIISTIGKPKKI